MKALDVHFLSNVKKFLKRSYIRLMSGQRLKSLLFALSGTERSLITAANPNLAKRLAKGLKI